jgi:hypothetical protein
VLAEYLIHRGQWHNGAFYNHSSIPGTVLDATSQTHGDQPEAQATLYPMGNGLEEDGVKIGIDFTPEENVYLLPQTMKRSRMISKR